MVFDILNNKTIHTYIYLNYLVLNAQKTYLSRDNGTKKVVTCYYIMLYKYYVRLFTILFIDYYYAFATTNNSRQTSLDRQCSIGTAVLSICDCITRLAPFTILRLGYVQNYVMRCIGQPEDRAFYSERKEKTPEKKCLCNKH